MAAAGVIVVGAGQAAASCAARLRAGGYDGPVTLFGDEPSLPYQRPPLSKKFLAGELDAERLLVRPPGFYEDPAITVRLNTHIRSLDLEAREALAQDGEAFRYDNLVLATGSRPRRMEVTGADLPGVHYLRTIADVDAIRAELEPGCRLSIVGGVMTRAAASVMSTRVSIRRCTSRLTSVADL